jgi:hypothetical protein
LKGLEASSVRTGVGAFAEPSPLDDDAIVEWVAKVLKSLEFKVKLIKFKKIFYPDKW